MKIWHVSKDDGINIHHYVVYAEDEISAKNKILDEYGGKRVVAHEINPERPEHIASEDRWPSA